MPAVIFLAVAFGLAWLVALPLWLTGTQNTVLWQTIGVLMMATPTVATIVAWFLGGRTTGERFVQATGLWPLPKSRVLIPALAVAWVGPFVLAALALLFGVAVTSASFEPDLTVSLREQLETAGLPEEEISAGLDTIRSIPTGLLWAIIVLQVFFGALINTVPAVGEEIGWRGYLHPALKARFGAGRQGFALATAVGGVIWGLWHAPLVLLGYNYEEPNALGLLYMCLFTIPLGICLAALRDVTGSVWPAALAHGAINASAGLGMMFSTGVSSTITSPMLLGWPGLVILWIVAGVCLAKAPYGTGMSWRRGPSSTVA